MREILYVQAGNLANHIGTHFWNTQESYFTYSDDEETLLNHDISFRDGETLKGEPTYCPRLLSFDHKANFGTLSRTNTLYENEDIDGSQLWQGNIAEYGRVPIEPHAYQAHLQTDGEPTSLAADFTNDIRYWSDFNRVFYIPRTVQMLPNVPDWQKTEGNWAFGQESFQRYNEETELMESSVRLFIEECNSFQGLQLMSDTSTFGSFSISFLMAFNDELSRAPCLSFPLLGDAVPRNVNLENTVQIRKVVNDAVYLRELDSLSSLTIPILNPNTWSKGGWDVNLKIGGDRYYTSSVLSAHIESSTLPLRLKNNTEDISSFSGHLNLHGSRRFSQLAGVFPVAAGVTPQDFWKHTHTQAYPLPSSFPDIFCDEEILTNYTRTPHADRSSVLPSATLFSSLSTSSSTAEMFSEYATYLQACVDRRKTGILPGLVETSDDIKELVNDLWTIHDGYSGSESDVF
ncbi:Misato segment II tubulin-like domain-containing protein [Lentinula boryana]|uniref:Misato segment II tubulin-like domain-containing protein n=1 Tax=Lentinula boryana TaxID=40481 RepID=A0ABQ8Q7W5_9AGAR|nr:Misato segment II tubulin-like domain-containing protein [Lentinula boryana]